jgi:hypothetical protein
LDQHHLAAFDHFLDLVLTARPEGALRYFFHDIVATDGFDDFLFAFFAVLIILAVDIVGVMIVLVGLAECGRCLFVMPSMVVVGMVVINMIVLIVSMIVICLRVSAISRSIGGRSDECISIGRCRWLFDYRVRVFMWLVSIFGMMVVMGLLTAVVMAFRAMAMFVMAMLAMMVIVVMIVLMIVMMIRIGIIKVLRRVIADLGGIAWLLPVDEGGGVLNDITLHALAVIASPGAAMTRTASVGAILGFFLGLAMRAFVGFNQSLTICHRDLVIVRMDFAEGKKAVAIATVFDEGSLQRRFYPRDLGKIDVATELLALGRLEIKFFDAVAAHHDHPGLFRMGGIDQHFVGHFGTHDGGWRAWRPAHSTRPGDATVHLIRG